MARIQNPSPTECIYIIITAVIMAACGWIVLGILGALMGCCDICTLSVVRGIAALFC